MTQVDRLFRQHQVGFGAFEFNESVARVFDDMIARSVPLYDDLQRCIPRLAMLLPDDPLRVLDLGCSTGTSLIHLALALPDRNLELWGVDNAPAMLDQCRQKLNEFGVDKKIKLVCAGLQEVFSLSSEKVDPVRDPVRDEIPQAVRFEPESVSIILCNYTMQFVPSQLRAQLLRAMFLALRPGGMLVLSEKFCHDNAAMDQQLAELYREYKKANGYSETEISRKRQALENVLVPWTVEENMRHLRQAGFERVELLLKWFNFGALLAYRA